MVNCSGNTLRLNNLSGNHEGLYLDEGMYPEVSSNNRIYLNSFQNNVYDVYSFISSNQWSSIEALDYQYRGKAFKKCLETTGLMLS